MFASYLDMIVISKKGNPHKNTDEEEFWND